MTAVESMFRTSFCAVRPASGKTPSGLPLRRRRGSEIPPPEEAASPAGRRVPPSAPHLPRVADRPADVRRGAARGDPDHGVAPRHPGGLEVARARVGVVLGPFDRLEERLASPPSGRRRATGPFRRWGDLRGVKGAQPPLVPAPNVKTSVPPRAAPPRSRRRRGDRGIAVATRSGTSRSASEGGEEARAFRSSSGPGPGEGEADRADLGWVGGGGGLRATVRIRASSGCEDQVAAR